MFELLNSAANIAQHGIGLDHAVLTVNRVAMGTFFVLSGYHKLFNAQRHASIAGEMVRLKIPFPKFNEWFVPFWEFTAGLMVVAGLFPAFAAAVLIIICLVATCTAGVQVIRGYEPIDKADWLDDLLYLPEFLYIIGLGVILAAPGFTILDAIQ